MTHYSTLFVLINYWCDVAATPTAYDDHLRITMTTTKITSSPMGAFNSPEIKITDITIEYSQDITMV